jgi:hypothetical protein
MIDTAWALVQDVKKRYPDLEELTVALGGSVATAINYPAWTGPAHPGDRVLLNVTAVRLGLGTGGVHFVMHIKGVPTQSQGPGHLMKLRYTPWQIRTLAVDEDDSPHRNGMAAGLDGLPVVVCELHSQMGAVAAAFRALAPRSRLVYVMTDGGALPLGFSNLVRQLRVAGLLDGTITIGHAFGGDLEAVNLHSALLAARSALRADACVVAMGPGVVGMGSRFGFSGLEQAANLDAANVLGGQPVAVVRMSVADKRARHRGISHHSQTVLGQATLSQVIVAVPPVPEEWHQSICEQLRMCSNHRLVVTDGGAGLKLLAAKNINLRSMGRSPDQDT